MSDSIMVWEKLREISEKLEDLTNTIEELVESNANEDQQEGTDSGEEFPPEEEEDEEEEEKPIPKVIRSGQQVSKKQMQGLNKPKVKPVEEDEEIKEDWEDDFKE